MKLVLRQHGVRIVHLSSQNKNDNKEELIGEISDLFYHVYVLMSHQGVTVEDIERKLGERHQVVGNKKDFHKRGDY